MIGKTFSYDRKNSLIRQFFDAYRKVLRRSIVLIISSCFGRFSGYFCPMRGVRLRFCFGRVGSARGGDAAAGVSSGLM